MTWKLWIKYAGIRAIKTVAQAALALLSTATVLHDVNWVMLLSSSALAGIISLLTSVITGLPEIDLKERVDALEEVLHKNGVGGGVEEHESD